MIRQGAALIDKYIEKHGMFSQLADQAYAFDKAIDIYREDFGNNVIVLPYELLASDRRRFLSLVEDAMGVDTFDIPKQKSNVSLSPNEIYWYPRFAAIIHFVPSDRVRSLLRRFHRKMIAVGGWKPLVGLLRLIFGERQQEFAFLKDLVPKLYNRADKLRQLEIYAPYRKGYGRD
jgi:hypothetical protein